MRSVRVNAHAKTNLFLHVLAREASGFHCIETLFSLLELHDELSVERTDAGIEIDVVGADTGPAPQNLAYRAAHMILEATGRTFGVKIQLTKAIPAQAGLGGGSSDGAATLHAVNLLAGNSIPQKQILEFAAQLGSDVPFFACRAPFALGWGRGERLLEINGPTGIPALIVVPEFGVSTRAAYASLAESRGSGRARSPRVLVGESLRDWREIRDLSSNEFEEPLFAREPRMREVFSRLEDTGPILTRLCGSGSALIALYERTKDRDAARASLAETELVIATETRTTPAPGPSPLHSM